MNLYSLKTGDKVQVYSFGELVTGTVIKTDKTGVTVKHKPQQWGRDEFTETLIKPSLWLQLSTSQTTPKAFYKGKEITI